MSTPIPLNGQQIEEIRRLVEVDMVMLVGYKIEVRECSKVGEEIKFRLYNLQDQDYTEEIQDRFNDSCYQRMLKVAGIVYDPINPNRN